MKRIILTLIVLVAILAFGVLPAMAQGQPFQPYRVRPGDTLSSIARSHCTTAQEVYALNRNVIGPNPNTIYAGMVLNVPNRCGGQTHPPHPGGVYDRGPSAHARGTVNGNIYTVAVGDTMFSVSARFGLTVQQLAAANGIHNPWWIYPGQKLVIPGLGGQPVPHPSPQPPPPWPSPQPSPQPCQPINPPQPCPLPCPPASPPVCPTPVPTVAPKVFITITAPASGAVLASTFEVRGQAGGLFEGNVFVRAYDDKGAVLAEQATTVQAPDAGTGGSGPWAVTLTVNVVAGTPGKIVATSPQSPNAGEASVGVVYGLVPPEVKVFPPGTCQFQPKPNASFNSSPGGPLAGTFGATAKLYDSSQSSKVSGIPWYMFETDPGSGNPAVWAPVTSIAAYTQGCIW